LREATGIPLLTDQRTLKEPYLVDARSQLDEASWESAFAEGKKVNLEEAAESALSKDDTATPHSQAPDESENHARPASLTRREEEIAALVAQGLTNRQIASDLSISEHTAATHVRRILKKLELKSRAQIGAWVTERGLPRSGPS
jgi:non-specific serine/threonine protein kinase